MDALTDEFELPPADESRATLGEALGLNAGALARADKAARSSGQPLAVTLSLLGLATEDRIVEVCARLYGAPAWPRETPPERVELPGVSARFLQDRYALAIAVEDGSWALGLVDPGDDLTVEALRFALGDQVRLRTLSLSSWRSAQPEDVSVEAEPENRSLAVSASWLDDAERLRDIARDAPVIRLADQLLERAFLLHASDLHVEQKVDHTRVRLRIDGQLQDQERLGPEIGPALIARIKVLSDLDVAERRAPQDGRTTVSVRGASVDVRVSTTPTVFGESLVVRMLTRRDIDYDLEKLGLRPGVVQGLEELLSRSHGLILVTGPTGSGKTTTLYGALRRLASSRNKILTIEDPVEYVFEDILQSQVNEAAGFTFSSALRAFLRHDPDVILVGEIRDPETARLAVQASLTGHLVLATVHTNDAASTPARLVDMGVERYLLGDALIGVMAQRLAPQLCSSCSKRRPLDSEETRALTLEARELPEQPPARAVGCTHCDMRGRRGRRAVSELLICRGEVSEAVSAGRTAAELRQIARAQPDFVSLRDDARQQSLDGWLDWTDACSVGER